LTISAKCGVSSGISGQARAEAHDVALGDELFKIGFEAIEDSR